MTFNLLKRVFPWKQIGWQEIGEDFIRMTLLWAPLFTIYLHRLVAPIAHERCHDHPWSFIALTLKGGYWEYVVNEWHWRKPWTLMWRPAEWQHNVVTNGVSWSVIITGPKRRQWGFTEMCQ